jgi:hypothetical protein
MDKLIFVPATEDHVVGDVFAGIKSSRIFHLNYEDIGVVVAEYDALDIAYWQKF